MTVEALQFPCDLQGFRQSCCSRKLKRLVDLVDRYFHSRSWNVLYFFNTLPKVVQGLSTKKMTSKQALKKLFQGPFHSEQKMFDHRRQKPEDIEYLKQYTTACAASACAHGSNWAWICPFGYKLILPETMGIDLQSLPGKIEIKEACFVDLDRGLKVFVLEKDGRAFIVFGAQHSTDHLTSNDESRTRQEKAIRNDVLKNAVGMKSEILEQAEGLVSQLKASGALKGQRITLTGNCVGGLMATYCGAMHELKVVTFNSPAMGAWCQQKVGDMRLAKAIENTVHIYAKRDWSSDLSITQLIFSMFSSVGVTTPKFFGKRVRITTLLDHQLWFKVQSNLHIHIANHFLLHLGYPDPKARPWTISNIKNLATDF